MIIQIPGKNPLDISNIQIVVPRDRVSGLPTTYEGVRDERVRVFLDPDHARMIDWPGGVGRVSIDIFNKCIVTILGPSGIALDARITDKVPAFIPSTYTDFIEFEVRPDGSIPGWVWDAEALAALTEWLSD